MTTSTNSNSASPPDDAVFCIPGLLLATLDLAGRFRSTSDALLATLGYDRNELTGMELPDLVHPDDLVTTIAAIRRAQTEGSIEGLGNRLRSKDGVYRHFRLSARFDAEHDRIVAWARDVTPIARETAKTDSGRLLPLVAETTPALIFLYDLNEQRVLYVNRQVTATLGYAQDELIASEHGLGLSLLHPDDRQVVEDSIARMPLLDDARPCDTEYRVRHSDGTYRWFWSQMLVFARDAEGRPVQIVGTLHDITERRIREESHQLLFRANPNPMWVFDVETLRILAVNDAALRVYGYTREEFLSLTIADIRPPEDMPEFLRSLDLERPTGQGAIWRHVTKSGQVLRVRIYSVELPFMGHRSRLVNIIDETEKLAAIERLNVTTNTMEAVLHQSPVAIFATDEGGRVQTWNPAASAIFGLEDKEAVGTELRKLVGHRSASLTMVQSRVLAGEIVESHPVKAKRHDGAAIELSVSARPLQSGDGDILGTVTVVADVTSKNAAERELKSLNNRLEHRVAERTAELEAANKELEGFCFSVAHDLRQPLRAIDGFSRAVIEDYAAVLDENGTAMLQRVRHATQRLGELMDALLALSRVTRVSLERDWVDLAEFARQAAADYLARHTDCTATVDIEPVMMAYGDPRLLRLLIENLLDNALKFSSRSAHPLVAITTEHIEGHTIFIVRDNGAGFDMRYAHKLFQPFERLHTQGEFDGHGVGLATCQRVVARHGGQITLVGSLNSGAVALFTLQPGPEPES